jgi:hypothetical protein
LKIAPRQGKQAHRTNTTIDLYVKTIANPAFVQD